MKKILILGAGQSAPYLISFLLEEAQQNDWHVTVADRDLTLAQKRVGGHPRGTAVTFDIHDSDQRKKYFGVADIIVNFLPPALQYLIVYECVNLGKNIVSASYQDQHLHELDSDAKKKGIIILNEMGLDPGFDHMSAMSAIQKIRHKGGHITEFRSYGTGLPAPEVDSNPLRYCITWNPRNVVMAGEKGAQYMENGAVKVVAHRNIFNRTWPVEVDGFGRLEAYPNRDSMIYQSVFNLKKVKTMIRATMRYPGWSEVWTQLIKLGMTQETVLLHELSKKTYAEFTEMFLPLYLKGDKLQHRVAAFLNINPTGEIMRKLEYLGLFSGDKVEAEGDTPANVLTSLLARKLPLPEGGRDVVILKHDLTASYPNGKARKERTVCTFIEYGKPDGHTAMAKTVGLPAAIGVKLILQGKLTLTGCQIPIVSGIYTPVLQELAKNGLKFEERMEVIS